MGSQGHFYGGNYEKHQLVMLSAIMQLCSERGCWANGSPSEHCAAKSRLKDVLNSTFQHKEFLPGQLEALLPAAHGKDVFVHMRTGGGKSLCMYLVPLAFSEAMGIVISPLIGLMEQQVSVFQVTVISLFGQILHRCLI